ncbi:MAG: endonuclease V [Candidatus Thermoplasmatota archaeon]|nr:methylated-DNA--[protein]-cysteine S-methyltransferase [Euryarchaeota archaeon]MBU4071157.1 endonuclease V [Candidatus Thermoplasmatota archaeon]MBU4144346.1 endonuclease V [Candidatus Thermoplasmatota archaeon]MBU4591942.1 endonuclease V [Candidatus Thermoplasmatota archaeon]
MIDLYQECADLVNQIPKGMVTTYGTVAKALGDEIAKRAVGVMLNSYGPPIKMPCHRVVYSGGGLGGFAYGLPKKMEMLAEEGVFEKDGKIADFENIFFDKFKTDFPLKNARKKQLDLAETVTLADPKKMPDMILGLDASYIGTRAFGAGILFHISDKKVVKTFTSESKINWPYIPTYLGFREMPVFKLIIDELGRDAILMLDGNGVLHPFGFGIASHIGVEFGMPSIGAAKSLLCGSVGTGTNPPVTLGGHTIGTELKTSPRAKPIYISPGHKISMASAVKITAKISRLKIPEPLRLAHMEATAMRRSAL